MTKISQICRVCVAAASLLAAGWAGELRAQPTIQFPQGSAPSGNLFTTPGGVSAPSIPAAPSFDPYAAPRTIPTPNSGLLNPTTPGTFTTQPPLGGSTAPFGAGQSPNMGWGSAPTVAPTWPGASPAATPSPFANPYGWSGQPSGQTLYPDGFNGFGAFGQGQQPVPLFQNTGLRYTFINGNNHSSQSDVQIQDAEVSATLALPNFVFSGQPIYVTPGFILSMWDGPQGLPADLPSLAYSGYLDFQYRTDPNFQIGAEVDARVGVYSDFRTFTDDSIRISGVGLGVVRVSPQLALKAGVTYLDRNRIKLLPAGGVFWYPTPQLKFDIFFPAPKVAMYLTTAGPVEIWGYLGAEYGGGAWTIQRTAGFTDRIDINDYRAFGGIEWTGVRGLHGFFEAGYVFNREVTYYITPADNISPPNTFMLRAGASF